MKWSVMDKAGSAIKCSITVPEVQEVIYSVTNNDIK